MIKLVDVTKTYNSDPPTKALDGISFEIPKGAFVAVTGRSGSGKSSLLSVIGCLARPSSGGVFIEGVDVSSADEKSRAKIRNEKIGFVFQSFHVLRDRNALDNVMLPARFSSRDIPNVRLRAVECLEKVGLKDRADNLCATLSGGQVQRVAIARALFMNPPILLADEPTGNLDTQTGKEILDLFIRLRRDENLTLLVVTHEDVVARAADNVLILEAGKLAEAIAR